MCARAHHARTFVCVFDLSPYLCIICFFGDDASISYGPYMRAKYRCVMIHIRIMGEVGTVYLV